MILGLGTDLVEIARLKKTIDVNEVEAPSNKLVKRVLTASEQEVFKGRWQSAPSKALAYLATRFAAKEAFAKAMGCGVGRFFSFQDLAVLNGQAGEPTLKCSAKLQRWLDERHAQAHVSLSDEQHYATATVLLSTAPSLSKPLNHE